MAGCNRQRLPVGREDTAFRRDILNCNDLAAPSHLVERAEHLILAIQRRWEDRGCDNHGRRARDHPGCVESFWNGRP